MCVCVYPVVGTKMWGCFYGKSRCFCRLCRAQQLYTFACYRAGPVADGTAEVAAPATGGAGAGAGAVAGAATWPFLGA